MNRLDVELVNRNIFSSRNKAQMEIKNGNIKCDGIIVTKSSFMVSDMTKIDVSSAILKYVSRGGLKLEKAINEFNIILKNKVMIDIGSSTGGFCDCALQNNISKIYAIDVGSEQLVSKIKNNSQVVVYEKTDFREIPGERQQWVKTDFTSSYYQNNSFYNNSNKSSWGSRSGGLGNFRR